jgi:hypothetical protein
VDPVPDPLLLRKSGSAGNQTRDLWVCSYLRDDFVIYESQFGLRCAEELDKGFTVEEDHNYVMDMKKRVKQLVLIEYQLRCGNNFVKQMIS